MSIEGKPRAGQLTLSRLVDLCLVVFAGCQHKMLWPLPRLSIVHGFAGASGPVATTTPSLRNVSRQAIANLLRDLRDHDILKVVREGRGRRAQVLALASLINLCEGTEVF